MPDQIAAAMPSTAECRRCKATLRIPVHLRQEVLRELGSKVRGGPVFVMAALKRAGLETADAKTLSFHLSRDGVCCYCSASIRLAPVCVCDCRCVNVNLTQVANALEPTNLMRLFPHWVRNDDIATGQEIFERIAPSRRPDWAADILEWCARRHPQDVNAVGEVIAASRDVQRWKAARDAFDRVRAWTLHCEREAVKDDRLVALLFVAEIAAKVTYNESGASAPFDHDSGWWMARCLRAFVLAQPDVAAAEREAWGLLTAPLGDDVGVIR